MLNDFRYNEEYLVGAASKLAIVVVDAVTAENNTILKEPKNTNEVEDRNNMVAVMFANKLRNKVTGA